MMSFLVQDFLDYAQIKSGKFRINAKPFDIKSTIDNVISIQKLKAAESGIILKTEFEGMSSIDNSDSSTIYSDEQRVMQVLLNLQSNALKFTRQGSITILAKILTQDNCDFLEVSVCDTGVGIPYEDQDKLFKLFGFVSSTQQYNRNGIGLGLVISEQIVTKFGGKISFKSIPSPEPNHGTTFTFTFKLQSEAEFLKQQQQEESSGSKYVLNSK